VVGLVHGSLHGNVRLTGFGLDQDERSDGVLLCYVDASAQKFALVVPMRPCLHTQQRSVIAKKVSRAGDQLLHDRAVAMPL
jgi:hypothetical protein